MVKMPYWKRIPTSDIGNTVSPEAFGTTEAVGKTFDL